MQGNRPAWLEDWLRRHRSALSFWLHMIGIPLTVVGVFVAAFQLWHGMWDDWWRPFVFWIAGYGLQWFGHFHEGNDMGEVIVVKRMLGKPFVAVSPRYAKGSEG